MKRLITIPFRTSVDPGSTAVAVSQVIDSPIRTKHFQLRFELNTNRTVEARFIAAGDSSNDSATVLTQNNLFRQFSESDEFVGDDQDIDMDHEVDLLDTPTFLKMHLTNNDAFVHEVDAQITVEILDRQPHEPEES